MFNKIKVIHKEFGYFALIYIPVLHLLFKVSPKSSQVSKPIIVRLKSAEAIKILQVDVKKRFFCHSMFLVIYVHCSYDFLCQTLW